MTTRITPPPTPAVSTSTTAADDTHIMSPNKSHTPSKPVLPTLNSNPVKANPYDLDPPKAAKIPTVVANYQSRWEREKAKARAEGTDIDGGDPKMIGPWVIGEMLGRGASGRVRLSRHFSTGKMAAVKILNLHPNLSSRASALANAGDRAEKMMLTAEREIAVMKLLDHPNIMKMYDVWSSPKELYLVLEYVQGGELFDYLCSRGSRLPLLEAISIIKQVLAGVNYCHRFNICHRDLKPENILLVNETVPIAGSTKTTQIQHVKIADFGMSTLDSLNGLLRTSCGSPHYASPEIVRGQTYSGAASDIWSCGVIFFALLTSRLPFDDPNVNNVLKKVRDGRFTIPDWVAPEAKDLLMRILEVDFNKRITMRDILAHPLLRMDTPGIILPPAPRLDELALPVHREEVDPDLLRNLCIIWREKDQAAMIARLCSDEKNFEKAFYFLLCRYRDRSFEEYNMDVSMSLPGSTSSSRPSSPFHLTSPVPHDTHPDRMASPIKRHYPGRTNPQILASLKKAAQRQPPRSGDGSPIRVKARDVEKSSFKSPRRSRVLSDASIASNSPRKLSGSSASPRRPGKPRSRAGTLRGSRGETDATGSRSRSGSNATKCSGVIGPAPTRKAPASPTKGSDITSLKRAPSVSSAKERPPRKTSDGTHPKFTSPKRTANVSLSKVTAGAISHRRAASASAVISVQRHESVNMNPLDTQTPGRVAGFKALPLQGGRFQGSIPEDKVADHPGSNAPPAPRSPVVVPVGIVQQRTSLLTSKLVEMGAGVHSKDQASMSCTLATNGPSNTCTAPTTPFELPRRPSISSQKQTPRMSRLPSGGIGTPTRPLARLMMAPTIFSTSPASANRASTQASLHQNVKDEMEALQTPGSKGTPKKKRDQVDGNTSSPPPSHHISNSDHSPNLVRTPGKSGRLASVFDTPSKSNVKGFLGSPNRMRGLGLFVSPEKLARQSPSKTTTPLVHVHPILDDDVTPKATLVHPRFTSARPLAEFGVMQKEIDAGEARIKGNHHRGRHGNRGILITKPKVAGSTSGVTNVPSESSSSLEPRISGLSVNMSGRSSGDTGSSIAEVWEKVDWSGDTSASAEVLHARNGQRLKKKPAPLDLFNPYQKERRTQAQNGNRVGSPLDIHRQSQSPLLSPFMGFTGFSWGGGSSTPPTPSLIGSSGMESGASAASSHVAVSSSGAGRGLFAKLFDWKSPNLQLLSMENAVVTRNECARLLKCLNVAFIPSETGGFNCRADDVIDNNGNHISKIVRFRLEIECLSSSRPTTPNLIHSLSSISASERSSTSASRSQWNTSLDIVSSPHPAPFMGYETPRRVSKQSAVHQVLPAADAHGLPVVCSVTLVQEKGAYSMLKIIYQRMQEAWRLDRSNSLEVNSAPMKLPPTPVSGKSFDPPVTEALSLPV